MAKSQLYKALALLGVVGTSLSIGFTNCAPAFQVLSSSTKLASSGGGDPIVDLQFDMTTPALMNETTPKKVPYSITNSSASSDYVTKCYLNAKQLDSCASPISLEAEQDGDATIRIVAYSKTGTVLSDASRTVRIDRKAPVLSVVTKPSAQTSSTTATIEYTVTDQLSSASEITVQCLLDTSAYAPCTSPRSFPALATGPHVIKLKATDKAGNTSPESTINFTVVVGLPMVNITQAPNPYINTTSATFAFTGSSTDSTITGFECSIDNGVTYTACTSPKTYQSLTDKPYAFAVRSKDATNQVSGAATRNFTVDTAVPSIPAVTSNLTGPTKTTSLSLSFSSTDSSGIASYQCAQDAGAFTACTSPSPYSALASGTRVFKVKATDQAGNTSPEGTYSIVIDTDAPVVNITGMPTNPTSDPSATFTFNATDTGSGLNVTECQLNTESSYSLCTSPKSYDAVPAGDRVFNVRVSDKAGNSTTKTYAWTVAATPTPVPTATPTSNLSSCGPEDRYFPTNAKLVPVSQKAQLQQMLDTYKIIRLEAGNYGDVTIRSGQQLYGLPASRTVFNKVTIEPGTSGAIVRGLGTAAGINFPPSEVSTHDNCFAMMEGGLNVQQGTLDNNLFLSFFQAGFDIDTSTGGALRNNKFLRMQTHDGGWGSTKAALSVIGDPGLKSTGNTFVFVNHLTPKNTPILFQNQNEITILGADMEDYDVSQYTEAGLTVKNVKKLRAMDIQGGLKQGFLDIAAEDFLLLGHAFYGVGNPPFVLRSSNKRAMWLTTEGLSNMLTDENPSGTRIGAERGGSMNFTVNKTAPASLTGPRADDALNLLQSAPANSVPWARPVARAIPDPAGSGWNTNLASKPDDAPAIQAMMDANPTGVVQLEARAYYLGSSLKLRDGTTILGAGPDKTVLIAKSPTINLIESSFLTGGAAASVGFSVMDLTLQGGNVGMSFAEAGIQSTQFYMSHVVIRDMQTAGIFLNKTYAWDNGYLEYVDFYRTNVGIKIYGEALANQESTTNAYMDKVFFYRNQYVENQKALEFNPARQSNMNVWFESSFRNNTVNAIDMNSGNTTNFFVSSDFTDNGGNPSINPGGVSYFVNSSFRAGPAKSLIGVNVYCEGCDISRGAGSTATLYNPVSMSDPREYRWAGLFNSKIVDVPLGAAATTGRYSWLFVNTQMAPEDSKYSIPMSAVVFDTKGTPDTSDDVQQAPQFWLTGGVVPGSKFLREPK